MKTIRLLLSFSSLSIKISHINPLLLLAVLSILTTSCNTEKKRITISLTETDSVIMHNPQAALDFLKTIDSSAFRSMSPKNLALYILLRTEAKYKCYHSITNDTSILKAVRYYNKNNQNKHLYARSLIMLGAVALENGDPVKALTAYKNAEYALRELNEPEQAGLVNTRLGELYRYSFINNTESAARYRKALTYFNKCGREDRAMYTRLSLARVLIKDSIESSLSHAMTALTMARKHNDTTAMLAGYELLTHICRLKNDLRGVIYYSKKAVSECRNYQTELSLLHLYNNIYTEQTLAYAYLGLPDSAEISASHIKWQATSIDTMIKHWVSSAIAESKSDWRTSLKHSQRYHALADSIEKATEATQIRYAELLLDKQEIEMRNTQTLREKNLTTIIFSLALICIICLIIILLQKYVKLKDKHKNLLASVNICNQSDIQNLETILLPTIPANESGNGIKQDIHNLILDMTGMISEINNTYFKYKNNIGSIRFISGFDDIIKKYFPEKQTYEKIRRLCSTLYPGIIEHIEKEHPELTQNDLLLIALMGCGFPTGAICAIKGMTIGSLNSQKTRTAKKMNLEVRLSEYIITIFSKNISAPITASNSDMCHNYVWPKNHDANIK